MARKHRSTSSFSLSFLDIMSCGLGAAVLIFLLLKHVVDGPTEVPDKQTYAEVSLLEEEIKEGEESLVRIRNTISDVSNETVTAQGLARQIQEDINKLKSQLEEIAPDSSVDVEGIRNKIARLESQKEALENTVPSGNKAYEFTGDGERQYLTGLKIGGERALILIDASASMLDETIVNIVRRRNMSNDLKLQAPKWQRAQAIAQWIVANLPVTSDFQVLTFNTETTPAYGDSFNEWYEVGNYQTTSAVVQGIMKTIPKNGTNMSQVFTKAMSMTPKPDNIYLVTDGLPTLEGGGANSGSVTGLERYRIFWRAIEEILPGIPVNTLLLPLEGDPYAAGSFWGLALQTRGSMITPARDWP
ncbi:MAG: hypothetical protein KTR16_12225 [Acidiferrobacterales bacterium]|nr:hypothetical protein [Acidiferrobacterales bacterium]